MSQPPSAIPASEESAETQTAPTNTAPPPSYVKLAMRKHGSQAGDFFVSLCFDSGGTFRRTRRFGFSRSLFQFLIEDSNNQPLISADVFDLS